MFARGRVGALAEVDGHPRGRVLAIPGLDRGLAARILRRVHASPLFPWEGKSFSSKSDASTGHTAAGGRGKNRVRFLRRALFSYRTYFTESVVDRLPAIAIDYDVPENPALVRATYDEIREVGDGLYLGRGMRRRAPEKAGPAAVVRTRHARPGRGPPSNSTARAGTRACPHGPTQVRHTNTDAG